MSGLKMIAQEKDIRIHIMLEVFTNNWSSKNKLLIIKHTKRAQPLVYEKYTKEVLKQKRN